MVAQVEDAWVYFNDKPSETTFTNSPLTMLTQRALDRRIRYSISLDYKDIPVEASYVLQVKNSTGITIKARSKWLNALHIQGTESDINNLLSLSFVLKIEYANKSLNSSGKTNSKQKVIYKNKSLDFTTDFNYGNGANQIQMLNGEVLHQNNFTGEGMQIAIIDAGFPNVDNFSAFQRIRDNNQILGGYDFVNRNTEFYTGHYHGMAVLSTIAGYIDDQFIGTAPDANFYLFISEDSANETPLEESLWVEAAERADSLGVDVINTSLGYTTFDNPNYNYVYNDMDGKTSFISRGAEIAFSRGMIVVNSAGNEGNDAWHYISAPADVASVLSIGAVNASGAIANFSSFGPTADSRIKPDVCAQGANVYIINSLGNIATSDGTSFSSPVLTGVITCLWEAFPTKTNTEITQLVKESSHLFTNPTAQEGYGIPDFKTIYNLLIEDENEEGIVELLLYPNPTENAINFNFPIDIEEMEITIFSLLGKNVYTTLINKNNPSTNISSLSKGLYMVQIKYNDIIQTIKILKN
tara:strand:- start:40450 stop:42024 length:1575 start_codon:yes stop_codon:yes gene_type:complete